MEIPGDILALLGCTDCGVILGRGPIFQTQDGAALCGGCERPERPASRNQLYEAVAKLLHFPCKNRELGCTENVPFAIHEEELAHEVSCPYRQYQCPVLPDGQCEWLGPRREMLEHCKAEHPDTVVCNGVHLTHDIKTSSRKTYLLYAFRLLFLLHTKVCVTTGKIFHSLCMLANPNSNAEFTFSLDVKRKSFGISKSYPVAPPGCLAMQEDTSIALNINSILEFLDGYEGTRFIVTVYDMTGCVKCSAKLKQYCYPDAERWLCESCAPSKQSCRNKDKGCVHVDERAKCEKHEMYFCLFSTQCYFCDKKIAEESLYEHYVSAHGDITYNSSLAWRNTSSDIGKAYIVLNKFGLLRTRCWSLSDKYELVISAPMKSEELHEYYCEIKLTHPTTKQTKTYKQSVVCYHERADWRLCLKADEFKCYNGQYDISVTLNRIIS